MNEYATFAVDIRPARAGQTTVHARWGEESTAESPYDCAVTGDELQALVACVGRPSDADAGAFDKAVSFGRKLYDAVFSGEVGKAYSAAREKAAVADKGLRLTLNLDACPELMDWPWEFLHDGEGFLALSESSPVARYLELSRDLRPLEVSGRIRIVGMVSSPAGLEKLDVAAEQQTIETAVAPLRTQDKAELVWVPEPTLASLYDTLDAARDEEVFHILHYVGHGSFHEDTGEGSLYFAGPGGEAVEVPASRLEPVLRAHPSLRLAILNTCNGGRTGVIDRFSGVAAALVRVGIPAVVGMQFPISDRAGVAFARRFYDGLLVHNESVDVTLAATRRSLFANDSDGLEWATPVVFLRNRSGRIFDFGKQRSEVVAEQPPTEQASFVSAVQPGAPSDVPPGAPAEVPPGAPSEVPPGAPADGPPAKGPPIGRANPFEEMDRYIASFPDAAPGPSPQAGAGLDSPQPQAGAGLDSPQPQAGAGLGVATPGLDVAGVLPGNWVVDMASPVYGMNSMQFTFSTTAMGRQFEGRAFGLPMMVKGNWSAEGNQLQLSGVQLAGAAPFTQQWPYGVAMTVVSLSSNQIQGVTSAGETVTFRRQ